MPRQPSRAAILLSAILLCLVAAGIAHAGDGIETAGDVLFLALPAVAGGTAISNRDDEGAVMFGKSAAVTLGATYALKQTVDERRPNGGVHSFPSGHASVSFASAEFLRSRYGWDYGMPAYAAALFVAYSRVESKNHYAHDVIAGAAIGMASSHFFTRPYAGWHVQAEADSEYFGIRLRRSF
ncbi:MAG: phosphatase PAP2 family protein [Nitrospirae bacterium]|nr:phosphatase PAP2 family protein [Nitrospirota bacterium]